MILERISDPEIQNGIIEFENAFIKPFIWCCRIMNWNCCVKSENKERKIESQPNTHIHCNLLVECVEFEIAVREILAWLPQPDIPGINKETAQQEAVYWETLFNAGL